MTGIRLGAATVALAAALLGLGAAHAADIISEWSTVQLPPPPQLKPVTVEAKTTALLVLDMMKENCGQRPRCVASVPNVRALVERARAASVFLAYTLPGNGTPIDPAMAPHEGEVVKQNPGGADKFLGDDLDQRLKSHGITTVIITGTSAQGVGIGTGSEAVQRGYKVIYPVDGVSSESAFRELYAAYHMAGGGPPVTTKGVTVTRSDMITFK